MSEEYVLYELPLSKGHAYRHALIRASGIKTYFYQSDSEKVATGFEILNRLSKLEVDE